GRRRVLSGPPYAPRPAPSAGSGPWGTTCDRGYFLSGFGRFAMVKDSATFGKPAAFTGTAQPSFFSCAATLSACAFAASLVGNSAQAPRSRLTTLPLRVASAYFSVST